jgi:hypothetical protein
MKKLMIVVMCLGLAFGAAAQGHKVGVYHGGVYAYRPRVAVGFYSPFYSPFGYGYPYWGIPYAGYFPYGGGYSRPTNLQRKEEDIRMDYEDRIYSVRQDTSLTNKQKRQEVRSLKKQRDQDIHELVMNYHKKQAPVPQENVQPQDKTQENAQPQDNIKEQ